jgi:glycosyltransferase involved in cell wall biosynthesis
MKPYFSIIIPVYNVASYLRECLDSVLAQTFTDWEAICVDDGSTDESGAILDEYAAKDKRFRVAHRENQGVVAARKIGLELSSGERILFLDSDDWVDANMLQELYSCASKNNLDVIQFGFAVEDTILVKHKMPVMAGSFFIHQLLKHMDGSPLKILGMCIWDKCYKRSIAVQAFLPIANVCIKYGEDALFAMSAFCFMQSIYFLRHPFYHYRMVQGSALHRYYRNVVQDAEIFIKTSDRLVRQTGIMSDKQIDCMNYFHAYDITRYVFMMALCQAKSKEECYALLHDLRYAEFFNVNNVAKPSLMRRCLRYLVAHERIAWLFRKILMKKMRG